MIYIYIYECRRLTLINFKVHLDSDKHSGEEKEGDNNKTGVVKQKSHSEEEKVDEHVEVKEIDEHVEGKKN